MNVKKLLVLSITAGLPVAMLGCASASNATDSTFSYIRGDERAKLGATPPKIVAATVSAANELALPVDSQSADGLIGKVMMHSTDGTKVEVNVKGEVNDQSEVTVRVGTFGDKTLQQRVLDKIKSHLVAGTTSSAVTQASVPSVTPEPAPVATPAPVIVTVPPSEALTPNPATASTPSPETVSPPPATKTDQAPEPANPLAPASAPATMPN